MSSDAQLYRAVWRWHFYAGLFVIPFILVLAASGSIYLFKPQVEHWEERAYRGLPTDGAVGADAQVRAVLQANARSQFISYRLPASDGDASVVGIAVTDNGASETREVYVSPQGNILHSQNPDHRLMAIVSRLHGQLLLGPRGSWLVELAASWAIVMIMTGLYLWWPRERRLAGVIWPRLSSRGRTFWRDLHAVVGFWVSIFALVLLCTGLPWAAVWGSAFRSVRAEMGWIKTAQQWTVGGVATPQAAASEHTHDAAGRQTAEIDSKMLANLQAVVTIAARERLAFPVVIVPPQAPQRFAAPVAAWTVKSEAQNRTLQTSILFDPASLKQISREDFADRHPIDRVIGYGVAWHEGQLFGWPNQLAGVLTALSLIALTVTGFVMWWRRKPEGALGAPLRPDRPVNAKFLAVCLAVLAALLPMLAVSLVIVTVLDRFLVRRVPMLSAWFGVSANDPTRSASGAAN